MQRGKSLSDIGEHIYESAQDIGAIYSASIIVKLALRSNLYQ